MIVTIIGLGLIGGSIAVDLRKTGFATELIGVDNSEKHCEKALQLGLVDQIKPLQQAVKGVDIVLVAVPVDKIAVVLPEVLDLIDPSTSVTDVGSTKHVICQGVDNHPRRGNYVPAHPMSGTENSGPRAKRASALHRGSSGAASISSAIVCASTSSKRCHICRA